MSMNWMEMFQKIFELCIIPLIGILATYLIAFIKAKGKQVMDTMENETQKKYLSMLLDIVAECVAATNQTYVESLKKQGKFDEAAQKAAFHQTLYAVMAILPNGCKAVLEEAVGDLEKYIYNLIEAEVNRQK